MRRYPPCLFAIPNGNCLAAINVEKELTCFMRVDQIWVKKGEMLVPVFKEVKGARNKMHLNTSDAIYNKTFAASGC